MKYSRSALVAMCLWTLSTWPRLALAVQARNNEQGHKQPPHHGMPEHPLRVVGGYGVPEAVAIKLWAGIDLTDKERDQQMERARVDTDVRKAIVDVPPTLQVGLLGPPDSGTNLIESTVLTNFFQGEQQGLSSLLFRHSMGTAEDFCRRYLVPFVPENFTVIVAIRSPISQLVSWHKAPYFLNNCTGRDFDEMGQPCFANASPDWNDLKLHHRKLFRHYPGRSLEFKNTMDVYNHYIRQYKDMLSEPACRKINVQPIRYEDMVFTPGEVMAELARKAGWPVPSTVNVVDSPAKPHGDSVGRSKAMERINTRGYLRELKVTDVAARCKELDAHLLRDQLEKSFSKAPTPYLKDCQGSA